MDTNKFFEMMEKVENSLNRPNVFKDGTKKEKSVAVLLCFVFIALWIWLFYEYVIHNNYKLELLSLFIFLVYASLFIYLGSFQCINRNVYNKSQTSEEKELNSFIDNLKKNKISKKQYSVIIEYFTNKISNEIKFRYNGSVIYLSLVVIPYLISYFSQSDQKLEIMLYLIIGSFFIPFFISLYNFFKDFKIIRYKKIVYLLNLQKMIGKY